MTEEQVNELYQLARAFCIKKHIWFDDDLIQDLVLHLYTRYDKYDKSKGSFSTFAFMCFKNYLYDKRLKNNPEILVDSEDEVFVDSYQDTCEKLIFEEILGVIQEDRIMMDWLSGMSAEEIARKENKHRTTISRHINKRIEEMRDYIGG